MDRGKIFTILLIALPILALIIGGSAIIILLTSLQDRPPTIYNPTHSDLNASIPIQIDVVVTDDRGVSSVKLTYTNDSWSNSYDITMSPGFLNKWAGLIPAQENETIILFKLTAIDNGGNIAINNNNSNYFYLYIVSLP